MTFLYPAWWPGILKSRRTLGYFQNMKFLPARQSGRSRSCRARQPSAAFALRRLSSRGHVLAEGSAFRSREESTGHETIRVLYATCLTVAQGALAPPAAKVMDIRSFRRLTKSARPEVSRRPLPELSSTQRIVTPTSPTEVPLRIATLRIRGEQASACHHEEVCPHVLMRTNNEGSAFALIIAPYGILDTGSFPGAPTRFTRRKKCGVLEERWRSPGTDRACKEFRIREDSVSEHTKRFSGYTISRCSSGTRHAPPT